ncbi:MAG: hypothetical protein HDT46_00865 [Ruminococcaceae bacterium]|nr:hypothetical protein [Oscillospiraceae bacterium]
MQELTNGAENPTGVQIDAAETREARDGELTPVPQIKEIKFFTDPKKVKKKTEGSIIAFQLIFTALFCAVYKLAELFAPELYLNISTYLERLFRW